MALLATLEGESQGAGVSLEDLFDVNDFLGVKIFGAPDWNRVKKCACIIASKAANNPVIFYIDSLKNDYPIYKASDVAEALFGFNDRAGVALMGSIPWDRLKVTMDSELLGKSWWGKAKSIGSSAVDIGKKVISAPEKAIDYLVNETPIQYTPAAALYNLEEKYIMDPLRDLTKDSIQAVQDAYTSGVHYLMTETPLKYTPGGQLVDKAVSVREEIGLATPGTAGVYESPKQQAAREAAEAEAYYKAQSRAAEDAANVKKQMTAQLTEIEAQRAQTQRDLDIMESRVTSRYKPIVVAGVFALLAASLLSGKNKKG
ncbi:MAG: hypothetical protein J5594_05755 [Elusimicrobiaceae bacterium]|nr:hypothetical protein [Elusimicrobiaceae bacterium]MBR4151735.1 hypothetical protein [Selenomonadaceae bacterium]